MRLRQILDASASKWLAALFLAATLGSARADTVIPGDSKKVTGDKRDRDGDGIPDAFDMCPDAPEDRDGFQDEDGCPDPDNDKDGIPDAVDKCPNDPETFNGREDEDGCPDTATIIDYVTDLQILDKIHFAPNGSGIGPGARPILDAIADTLKGNPDLLRVEVGGHADRREIPSVAQARAVEVMRYLVAHGVDAKRLTVKGYGATHPLAQDYDPLGRERNRRVEFVILERAPKN
jgi:outer membrane protein OmpA-like peptidoglycan-associated protein